MKKTFFLCVFFIALFSCSNEKLVENETVIDINVSSQCH